MTIYIFVLKGDLNGENRSGAFLFFVGYIIISSQRPIHLLHHIQQSNKTFGFLFWSAKCRNRPMLSDETLNLKHYNSVWKGDNAWQFKCYVNEERCICKQSTEVLLESVYVSGHSM